MNAQVGTRPKGRDCLQARALPSDAVAVGHALNTLSADHEAHKQRLAAIEARFNAWSDRIDALCEEWSKHNAGR